uniref:Protein msta n=1 Tax=Timema douglasi TaxID=61478 RepID=A0A7R8VWQ7_TIMDO|nr:unnamed protein product [Timema douglasi]
MVGNTAPSDRVGKDVNQSWNTEVSVMETRTMLMPTQTSLRYSTSSYFSLSLTHTDEGNKPLRLRHFVSRPRATHDDTDSGFTQGPFATEQEFKGLYSRTGVPNPMPAGAVASAHHFLNTAEKYAVLKKLVRCMTGRCAVCQAPATQCCSSCRAVFYCSRDHQKQHWRHHKTRCAPYRVEVDERLGRFLVASRDIKQGELILREPPLVLGPKTATFPLCLGCHRRLPSDLEGYHVCSGCNWPLCGPQCEGLTPHQDECRLMRESEHKADIPFESPQKKEAVYCNIAPLRCLLLREKHADKFSTLLNLQSHLEDLRDTSLYNLFKTTMIGFLLDGLRLTDVDPEMILRMCAILDTNAFDVRRNEGEVNVRGVYPTASFLSHDCTPNTKYTFVGPEFSLVLTATVPIGKGDVISMTYTRTLWGTLGRRANLRLTRCFDCTCARCSDRTELGTHAGAISCAVCKRSGKDSKVLSTAPLDSAAVWRCESCPHSIPGRQMAWGNDAVRQEMEAVDKRRSEALEEFLEKYGGALHSTNSHILEVKYVLARLYGNEEGHVLSGQVC